MASPLVEASDAIILAQRTLEEVFPEAAKADIVPRHIASIGDARLQAAVALVLTRKRDETISGTETASGTEPPPLVSGMAQ